MRGRPVCLVCLLLMLCMCILDAAGFSLISGNPLPDSTKEWIAQHPESVIRGEVEQCGRTEYSLSVCLKHVFLTCGSEQIPIENLKIYFKSTEDVTEEDLPAGMLIEASGSLEEISAPCNPGEFDSRQYYACRHIYYFMKNARLLGRSRVYSGYRQFLLEIRQRFSDILREAAGEDAGVFAAMLLGDKTGLDNELKLRYQMAGMIHILAISGLHISMLGMGVFYLLKRAGCGNVPAGIAALFIMLQYGLLTGSSVSAMRAVCMFLLTVGARILGRSYDLLTALSLSAVLLLLESPAYLYSSGFLMSFGAVVGLGAVSPVMNRVFCAKSPLIRSLLSSGAVQAVTLPLMLKLYGEVSVAGIFLNLAVLPTVGVVLGSGLICALSGLVSIRAACVAALPGRALLFLYEKACELAGRLPFCTWIGGAPEVWQIFVYYVLIVSGLTLAWVLAERKERMQRIKRRGKIRLKKKFFMLTAKRSLCAAGIFILTAAVGIGVLAFHPRKDLTITCLDVGQGDCAVISVPGGGTVLSDCGSSNKSKTGQYQLLPFLKNQGISYLDCILVSHTDEDHISGVRELLEFMEKGLTGVRAGTLVLPDIQEHPAAYQEMQELAKKAGLSVRYGSAGMEFGLGKARFCLLAPEAGAEGEDINENCIVTELTYGDFTGLFTGDIGQETEEAMMGQWEDVDFLKVAHHGSKYSTGEAFLNVVRPEIAVASSSSSNIYGHPSLDTLARLEAAGSQIYCTKDSGAVTVRTDGERIWVDTVIP